MTSPTGQIKCPDGSTKKDPCYGKPTPNPDCHFRRSGYCGASGCAIICPTPPTPRPPPGPTPASTSDLYTCINTGCSSRTFSEDHTGRYWKDATCIDTCLKQCAQCNYVPPTPTPTPTS